MRWGWERLAALAGVVAVVLWVVGAVMQDSSNLPQETPEETLAWFRAETGTLLASSYLWMLGSVFFVIFLGALRLRLLAVEGPTAFFTAIAFAGGTATAILTMLMPGGILAGAISENELTADSALTLTFVELAFFGAAKLSAALMLAAAAVVILRYRALPRWIGWSALLLALLMLIPPIGWAGLLLGLPLWTLVVAITLWMRPATEPGAPRA